MTSDELGTCLENSGGYSNIVNSEIYGRHRQARRNVSKSCGDNPTYVVGRAVRRPENLGASSN